MGLFFVYILKSSICLAAFYLFFRWLMARETFHRFNRFALVGILVLSCLLPLVQVNVGRHTEVQQTMLSLEALLMMADMEAETGAVAPRSSSIGWVQGVLLVYLAGIIVIAIGYVCSMVRLWMLIKSGERKAESGNAISNSRLTTFHLIVHNRDLAPFSWMRYVVISRADLEENGREILAHELAHIRNHHSWDLLVADCCILFQWFNPAAWLLKQELQSIHEYEADATVLSEGVDAKEYQLLLIKKAVGTRLYSLANSLNHSKLKKRITMMQKEKSNPWARLKYFYVLPVAALTVAAFARPEVTDKVGELSGVKVSDLAAITEVNVQKSTQEVLRDTTIFEVVEVMPKYPDGGMQGFMNFLARNMRYPEDAKRQGKQGRVVVQFVVDADGAVKDPHVVRSVDPLLDSEALRLISLSPQWKPGMQRGKEVAVKFTVPIKFKLDDSAATQAATAGVKVEGIVVDEQDNPIIGACVKVEGSTLGTVTNMDGKFTLNLPQKDAVLVIMYIDMETVSLKVSDPDLTVRVKMKPE